MLNRQGIEALGRDQSCTTRGHTFDENDIEDGWEHYANDNAINLLSSQQKVRTEMNILGLIINIFVVVLGVFLLVTAKDGALASISGMCYAILGFAWVGFYYAMLMGW